MGDATAEGQKVLYICISVGLVLMGGLMSGLTLGLMSLDQVDLEVCTADIATVHDLKCNI